MVQDYHGLFHISSDVTEIGKSWYICQLFVVMTGILTNTLVLILAASIRQVRAVPGIPFLANMACANCSFCTMTLLKFYIMQSPEVRQNLFVCNFLAAMVTFTGITSSLARCAVAFDRYVYISAPLHYYSPTSDKRTMYILIYLWIASASLTLPPYIYAALTAFDHSDKTCLPSPIKFYVFCVLVFGVIVPMICEVFIYTWIFYSVIFHIQIMKQQANYYLSLSSRSAKESYKVDIRELELYARASLLMASALLTIRPPGLEEHESIIDETGSFTWSGIFTRSSQMASYLGSLLKLKEARGQTNEPQEVSSQLDAEYHTHTPSPASGKLGSQTDDGKTQSSVDEANTPKLSMSTDAASKTSQGEDNLREQFRKLSDHVQAKGFTLGSQALGSAINKLLTCTEMKSGAILFITLGSAVGLWLPFLILTTRELIFHDHIENNSSIRQFVNVAVLLLPGLDPIVYAVLLQPFRKAVMDNIKKNWKRTSSRF